MRCILFELPDILTLEITSVWLEIEDIRLFDTSLCSTNFRIIFLELLRCSLFTLQSLAFLNVDDFVWVKLRRLKLSKIFLVNSSSPIGLLDINRDKIDLINFGLISETNLSSENFVKIINSCPNIKQLEVLHDPAKFLTEWTIKSINTEILKNLNLIALCAPDYDFTPNGFSDKSIEYLSNICENLTYVHFNILENELSSIKELSLNNLLKHNRNITHLSICGCTISSLFIDFMVQTLPKIEKIQLIENYNELSIWDIKKIVLQCKFLSLLNLSYKYRTREELFYRNEFKKRLSFGRFYQNITDIVNHQMAFDNIISYFNDLHHFIFNRNIHLNLSDCINSLYKFNTNLKTFAIVIQDNNVFNMRHIIQILAHFKQLNKFGIFYCKSKVVPIANSELITAFSTPNILTSLSISKHNNLTTDTVISLIQSCKNVTHLNITFCNLVDDFILSQFILHKCGNNIIMKKKKQLKWDNVLFSEDEDED
jgi:hypothetical protein